MAFVESAETSAAIPAKTPPLAGIRVVEMANVLMAPYAAQILGDLGADVVKVEPFSGDTSRVMGAGPHKELSGIALNLHRNKRSMVLDLESAEGREVVQRLLARADVLVTNMKPSSLEKMGLSYDQLADDHPGLIYCEAHGFRSDSSEANRPVLDDVIQAITGIPPLNIDVGGSMQFAPVLIADKVAGLFIVEGVLAALYHRAMTGHGQRVEVPMFDAILGFNLTEHLSGAAIAGEPVGYSRILTANRGPHESKDGWVAIMPYTNKQWRALYEAVGEEAKLEAPWHRDQRTRLRQADVVYGELKEIIRTRTSGEWLEICARLGVPSAPVPTLQEIVSDPELHRGVLREEHHPVGFEYRQIAPPVRFFGSPLETPARPAPRLGQDSADVLAELGYSSNAIEELIEKQVTRGLHEEPTRKA